MNNDNNMVGNQNQGNSSPIIPKNINSNGNQLFQNDAQNNINNSSTEDDINYTPAVNVPGLDDLEDYIDEEATANNNVVNANLNIQNSNLNSNNFNSNTSVNANQANIGIDSNIENQAQIDMAEIDDTFDNNSKNFSPNIDMTGLVSGEDLGQDEVFNPTQELGVDANNFGKPTSQLQSKPADFGFDPFNKFDEATEENFLPGFDQNFYNPDYDDSTNFMPGIVPEDASEESNNQPVVEDFIPNENIDNSVDVGPIINSVTPPEPVQTTSMPKVQPVSQTEAIPNNVVNPMVNGGINPMQQVQYPPVQEPPIVNVEPVAPKQNAQYSVGHGNAVQYSQARPTEPINGFVNPPQQVKYTHVPNANGVVSNPSQPMQYTPVQENVGNVEPVKPVETPQIPNPVGMQGQYVPVVEPNNGVVEPINSQYAPINNNVQPQDNGVIEEPIIENPQPNPVVNPFDMNGGNDLVNSIDSLEDYSNSNTPIDGGIDVQQYGTAPVGNEELLGRNNISMPFGVLAQEPANDTIASISPRINYSMSNFNSLLTPDKKIVTFVGTSKNGTSFLVNNLAAIFSSLGINTAILDMTHNRNSYYIYTKCDENLRKISYTSIDKLKVGESEGIKVNKNLTVYTALPNDGKTYSECEEILTTLAQNHSLVLIDCDFTTPMGYFTLCQEIYLVQSLDILTIQPLTAFLRDLKSNNILEPEKVRVVVNKDMKVGKLTSKIIISGMSSYNDPSMSFMTELFNKDTVNYCVIPFDERAYSKYLEGVVNCEISVNGFSSGFVNKLKTLAEMIYPLTSKQAFGKNNHNSVQQMQPQNTFSNSTNNTLNKMKNNM